MTRPAVFYTLILLASGVLIGPAHGAVRDCADFVESSGGGQTEEAAKTNALDGWMRKVESLGMKQVRWQMAADRSLECTSVGGVYSCTACARPCVIKQVAPERWRAQQYARGGVRSRPCGAKPG